jgi:hypothetical protein
MPNPDSHNSESFELYDPSVHTDDSFLWLVAEEDLALLDGPSPWAHHAAELLPLKVDSQIAYEPKSARASIPESTIPFSPSLSYPLNNSLLRRTSGIRLRTFLRVAAVVAVLLIGAALPSIIERLHPAGVKASPELTPAEISNPGIAAKNPSPRIISVMVGREETINDMAVRYTGHVDDALLLQIRDLNPDLKDFRHLEDGQIVRLPLSANPPAR